LIAQDEVSKCSKEFGRKQGHLNGSVVSQATTRKLEGNGLLLLVGDPQGNIAQRP
jgi:hypothetical protein